MSQDHLGLFDTPPLPGQVRLSLALVALLIVTLIGCSLIPDVRTREINAFIPIADTIMLFGDLITATVLYAQASLFRSRALVVLASGYVLTALLLVAHLLTFPGAFAPDGLLGAKTNTTSWIAIIWRTTPLVAILLYTIIKRAELAAEPGTRPLAAGIATGVASAIVLAVAITMLATIGHDWLPPVFMNRTDLNNSIMFKVNCALIALMIVTTVTLFLNRKSVLDMWLLVALSGWLAHALLNIQAYGRFTVSFYSQFALLMFSNFVVMLALLAEANRLYVRLAETTAARRRESDARLLSMDALAAAISHEVGQPLTAVALNTRSGLTLLTRSPPDTQGATKSFQDAAASAQRAFDVLKSVRGIFARRSGNPAVFNLNDLVKQTASVLGAEMALAKVSLQLELDEMLPPVRADMVPMQQVLVNLLTNAMEAMGKKRRSDRRIAVRSVALGDGDVLLEVSDMGEGIAPEHMPHLFDAFYTTKPAGTGLGLSLCRTIVEGHGGRLWASPGDGCGATFHVQLPRAG